MREKNKKNWLVVRISDRDRLMLRTLALSLNMSESEVVRTLIASRFEAEKEKAYYEELFCDGKRRYDVVHDICSELAENKANNGHDTGV